MQLDHFDIEVGQRRVSLATVGIGSGPTIVLLHGWLHSKEIWRRITPLLAGEFHLLAIDLPGFGDSAPLENSDRSINGYATVIKATLLALTRQHAIAGIVADSLSGVLLANAVHAMPFLERQRFLISGCPFEGLPAIFQIVGLSALLQPGLAVVKSLPKLLGRSIIRRMADYTLYRDIDSEEIVLGVLKADPHSARVLFEALKPPTSSDVINSLSRHQCTLLRGEFDRISTRCGTAKWANKISANYIEISKSAHVPMIEQPDAYAGEIRSLFGELAT